MIFLSNPPKMIIFIGKFQKHHLPLIYTTCIFLHRSMDGIGLWHLTIENQYFPKKKIVYELDETSKKCVWVSQLLICQSNIFLMDSSCDSYQNISDTSTNSKLLVFSSLMIRPCLVSKAALDILSFEILLCIFLMRPQCRSHISIDLDPCLKNNSKVVVLYVFHF